MRNKIRNLENIIEKQKKRISRYKHFRRSQPAMKVSLVLETKSKAKSQEHNITHIDSVCTEFQDIEISIYNEILGIKKLP